MSHAYAGGVLPDAVTQLIGAATMEVSPRSAAKVEMFSDFLPAGRRVYVAHLDGSSVDDMVSISRRLTDAGYRAMPHIPARAIASDEELQALLSRYADEAGVREALVIAGNAAHPIGRFSTAMDLIDRGHFDALGFERIHFAAHPEGNGAVAPEVLAEALVSKRAYAQRTDAIIGLATQFLFDAQSLRTWLSALCEQGIDLPVHVGIAGPTNPLTLLRYALVCGVGPSIKVLQKQVRNVRNLARPYSPDDMIRELAERPRQSPNVAGLHVFPFGGVSATAEWISDHHARSAVAGPR